MEYRSQIKPLYGTPLNHAHWANRGLVGQWLFNEGSGLIAHDTSGNGNHGTLTNMAPMSPTSGWVPGPHGAALAFDGSNDYVNCGTSDTLRMQDDFTLVSAITPITFDAFNGIFSTWGQTAGLYFGMNFSYTAAGALQIYWGRNSDGTPLTKKTADGIIIAQQNKVMAITKNINIITFYANGAVVGTPQTISGESTIRKSTTSASVGFIGNVGSYRDGDTSYLDVYNRALSAQEIAYLYAFPWCGYIDTNNLQYREQRGG